MRRWRGGNHLLAPRVEGRTGGAQSGEREEQASQSAEKRISFSFSGSQAWRAFCTRRVWHSTAYRQSNTVKRHPTSQTGPNAANQTRPKLVGREADLVQRRTRAMRVISMGRSRWGAELGPIGIGRGLSHASGPEPPTRVSSRLWAEISWTAFEIISNCKHKKTYFSAPWVHVSRTHAARPHDGTGHRTHQQTATDRPAVTAHTRRP
jgi:hypothetical protein